MRQKLVQMPAKNNLEKIAETIRTNKKALLKSVRISPYSRNKKRTKLIDKDKVLTQRSIIKDINQIREYWSLSYSDLEIRKKMRLTYQQWKRRLDRMRAVPPQDDTVKAFTRYYLEHTKYIAKLERRQRRLNSLYERCMEDIEIIGRSGLAYKKPRDLELARTTVVDLAAVDKDMIKAEQDLVAMKQKLGIIDQEVARVEVTNVFNVGVLEQAWALRKQKQLVPTNNPDQKAYIEDAILLENPVESTEKAAESLNDGP